MDGVQKYIKQNVEKIVNELFDKMAFSLLGQIPHLKNKKMLVISSKPHMGLGHLFLKTLGKQQLNEIESEMLKHLLETAYHYIDALKTKTKERLYNNIVNEVERANKKGEKPSERDIKHQIVNELRRAGDHMATITAAELNKVKNVGTAIKITKVASDQGDDNPTVVFLVVKDDKTCEECKRLHLLKDGITPRAWKLSEIGYGYHTKGDENPKIGGLHPHCRCFLTFVPKNFGFINGRLSFIDEGYDEFKKQRNEK